MHKPKEGTREVTDVSAVAGAALWTAVVIAAVTWFVALVRLRRSTLRTGLLVASAAVLLAVWVFGDLGPRFTDVFALVFVGGSGWVMWRGARPPAE